MSLRWLAVLLPLYSIGAHALEMPNEIFEYVDNERVVAFVNESDIDDAAAWKQGDDKPALSVAGVAALSHDYVERYEATRGAVLDEITLRRIPQHDDDWHYMVKMHTEKDGEVSSHYLFVLMSGKVIPAINEPEAIK
jgi:hypothetical protein